MHGERGVMGRLLQAEEAHNMQHDITDGPRRGVVGERAQPTVANHFNLGQE